MCFQETNEKQKGKSNIGIICCQDTKRKKKEKSKNNTRINTEISLNKNDSIEFDKSRGNITPLEKGKTIKIIDNQKLLDFLNKNNIQGLQNETNDLPFNELKAIEKEILKEEVENNKNDLTNKISKKLNIKNINATNIDNIMKNESTDDMIINKISDISKEYERDENKYSIEHLKILLVGRKGIGKTDLVNYILKLEPEENSIKVGKQSFREYTSEEVPFLKLVEFEGIGFDDDSNPEEIGKRICGYINNELKKKKYDEIIHCIWYCMTETKFEVPEIAVLKKLKNAYKNDNVLPVIAVYTKTESKEIAKEMENHIKKQDIDTLFITTLAKSFCLPNGTIKEAFGREELLNKTLEKVTQSLQGKLLNIMSEKISEEIYNDMININKNILKTIQERMIDNFVNDFVKVLNDGDLIDYIINIIVNNLSEYYEKKISNKSFNSLNKSEFIKEVKSQVANYKAEIKKKIKTIIEEKAKIFLDEQAKIEIKKGNMEIKNKRKLNEFKKKIEILLKKNFYYISQKLMIAYILDKIFNKFFKDYNDKMNEKIKNILNINKNQDTKIILENTFLIKLKQFGDRNNINIEIKKLEEENDVILPKKIDVEGDVIKQSNINLITNSFNDIIEEQNEIEIREENNNFHYNRPQAENNYWFPLDRNKKWKYIKEKLLLENFLQSMEYQDDYFIKETYDPIFKSLKNDIRNDLIAFINKKKAEFIKNIDGNYSKKKFTFENNIIPKVIENESLSSIYDKHIGNEIKEINKNPNEIKLDYVTILVVGRSGIGKSELINCMLKSNNAKTGVGFRVTLQNDVYKLDNQITFLQMIDTRGTETIKEFNLEQIKNNVKDVIKRKKTDAKQSNNLNENIQCIYYCVKGGSIEESEIKTIEEIKNNEESIPVIVVFTMGINMGEIDRMRNIISSRLNLPFIPVLSKKIDDQESYGLDDLLKLTLDECQKAKKGNVYEAIKNKINTKIEENIKKINDSIKFNIGQNLLKKIINQKKELDENGLYEIIYNYLETTFLEFMKYENYYNVEIKEESKDEFKNSKLINNYIKKFIEFYEKKSKEFVEPVLDDFSLEYLDMQVKKEKIENKSIERENKNDRASFKNRIERFLNSNLYYISQKYLLYRFLYDMSEPFSEELETKLNDIVKMNLEKEEIKKLVEKTYDKIFEDFRKFIFQNYKGGKIYEINKNFNRHNVNFNNYGDSNVNNYKPNYNGKFKLKRPENKNDLECPYPPLDKKY